jgi:hypothetical protein
MDWVVKRECGGGPSGKTGRRFGNSAHLKAVVGNSVDRDGKERMRNVRLGEETEKRRKGRLVGLHGDILQWFESDPLGPGKCGCREDILRWAEMVLKNNGFVKIKSRSE